MDSRFPLLNLMLGLVLAAATGCKTTRMHSVTVVTEITEEYVSAETLAGRLGMSLDTQTPRVAVLSDPNNRITIFPGKYSRVIVNGRPLVWQR